MHAGQWIGLTVSALVHLAAAAFVPGDRGGEDKPVGERPVAITLQMFAQAETKARVNEVVEVPRALRDPVPEPEPVAELTAKPAPKPKPKVEPKAEPKPQPKPQPKPRIAPTPMAGHEPQPAPAVSADVTPTPVTERVAMVEAPRGVMPPGPDLDALRDDYLSGLVVALDRNKRYPRQSRRRREEGTVTIGFVVERSGTLAGLQIIESSGSPRLDRAALATVEELRRYRPIPDELQRTRWPITLPVRFQLR